MEGCVISNRIQNIFVHIKVIRYNKIFFLYTLVPLLHTKMFWKSSRNKVGFIFQIKNSFIYPNTKKRLHFQKCTQFLHDWKSWRNLICSIFSFNLTKFQNELNERLKVSFVQNMRKGSFLFRCKRAKHSEENFTPVIFIKILPKMGGKAIFFQKLNKLKNTKLEGPSTMLFFTFF